MCNCVTVEETTVTDGSRPRRIDVPVETPEGTAAEEISTTKTLSVVQSNGNVSNFDGAAAGPVSVGSGAGGVSLRHETAIIVPHVTEDAPAPPAPPVPVPTPKAVVSGGVLNGKVISKPQPAHAKLHPLVASLVERLREGKETPGEAEAKFVREGKAELRIWLTKKSPAVLAQLKELGFELILDAPSSGLVVGRMPIEKISMLADIPALRYVAPEESQK